MASLKPSTTAYSPAESMAGVTLMSPIPHQTLPGEAILEVIYTPDREVLTPTDMFAWLKTINAHKATTWESLGTQIIEAFYDTLLPHQVKVSLTIHHTGGLKQLVTLERQRPK